MIFRHITVSLDSSFETRSIVCSNLEPWQLCLSPTTFSLLDSSHIPTFLPFCYDFAISYLSSWLFRMLHHRIEVYQKTNRLMKLPGQETPFNIASRISFLLISIMKGLRFKTYRPETPTHYSSHLSNLPLHLRSTLGPSTKYLSRTSWSSCVGTLTGHFPCTPVHLDRYTKKGCV